VKENVDEGIELEIREHSDADFFPEHYPHCKSSHIRRLSYRMREIQDLGEHPLIPIGTRFIPGVIEYIITRVLKIGESIRRVWQDLK